MEKKNVLLVYPKNPYTFWSFRDALKFVSKQASLPPLGLMTIAAMLPINWEIRLVDLNIERLDPKDIIWADYVFISAMSIQKESLKTILPEIKKYEKIIVAGGPLFTLEDEEEYPEIDHFVLGEGEVTLPKFLKDLRNNDLKKRYIQDKFPDIKYTPPPRWDLVKIARYGSVGLQYSRGCPFDCEFCNITTMFGHVPRTKTAKQLIGELDGLYERGYRGSVFVVDDNFIGNRKELIEHILPALIEWRKGKIGMTFYTELSINIASDETLMMMMVKAGFKTVFVGIETTSIDGLLECNKIQNTKADLLESVKKIQSYGLEVQAGFIVGLDSDDPSKIFQELIEFIRKSGIVTAMVGLLQAPTKTKLWIRMKETNRLKGNMSGDNGDGTTNIIPKMDIKILLEGYKKIISEIYDPKVYYKRIITHVFNLDRVEIKPKPFVKPKFYTSDFKALVLSFIYQGIISKERKYYWEMVFKIFFNRPKYFAHAITLAIYGRHYYLWMKSIVSRTTQIA
jgi:radical SAM superfamily enzyme YgiQ (UPF0313 family)